MKQSRGRAILGGTIFAATIAVAGYAFTASNTVPASRAGDGQGNVTGYTVTNIHYGLSTSDPSKADSVSFNLDTAPVAGSTIKAKVDGSWYTCINPSTTLITCDTTGGPVTVLGTTSLQVVVAE